MVRHFRVRTGDTSMIIGLGTDIAELQRIRSTHERFGEHFLRKILTPVEIMALPMHPIAYIAGRFAAKEAAVKALGTGFSRGISFMDIEIVHGAQGRPLLYFLGSARVQAERIGVRTSHVSISHSQHNAIAVVVLED